MNEIKKYLFYLVLLGLTYWGYQYFNDSPNIGVVTLENIQGYYIPHRIRIFNSQNQEIAKIEMDNYGNQTKSSGKIPRGRIQIYYELTPESKKTFMESQIDNNKISGKARIYYPSGKLYYLVNYQDGLLVGDYQSFYENGQLKEEGSLDYHNKKSQKLTVASGDSFKGVAEARQSSGIYKLEPQQIAIQNISSKNPIKSNGAAARNYSTSYFGNVQIYDQLQEPRIPSGVVQSNGKNQDRIIRQDRARSIDFSSQQSNAAPLLEKNNQNKLPNKSRSNSGTESNTVTKNQTVLKKYYPSGKIYVEIPYSNGEVDGAVKFYFENGNPRAIINFTGSQKDGLAKTFFENGNLESEALFDKDILINKKLYNERGELLNSW